MDSRILFVLTFGVMLVLFSCNVSALTEVDSCGTYSSAGETYILNTSISDYSGGDCIVIQGENITFDCNGSTIDGTGSDRGMIANRVGVILENCIVTEFDIGVLMDRNYTTARNINVSSSTDSGFIVSGSHAILDSVNSDSNGGVGFDFGDGINTTIQDSTSTNNGNRGLLVGHSSTSIVLTSVTSSGNTDDGIIVYDTGIAEIHDSLFYNNTGNGIECNDATVVISDTNSTYNDGNGISISSALPISVDNIIFSNNGGNNMYLTASNSNFTNISIYDANSYGIHMINSANMTFNNIVITNSGSYNVYAVDSTDVIFNVIDSSFSTSNNIYFLRCDRANINGAVINNSGLMGIYYFNGSGNVKDSVIENSSFFGLRGTYANPLYIENVNVTRGNDRTYYSDFDLRPSDSSYCSSINASDSYGTNEELYYFVNSADTLDGVSFSHIQLCDADGATLSNLNLAGEGYNGIRIQDTDGLTVENVILSNVTYSLTVSTGSDISFSNVHWADTWDISLSSVTNLAIEDSSITNMEIPSQSLRGSLWLSSSTGTIDNLTLTTNVDGSTYSEAVYFSGSTFTITNSSFTGANTTLGFRGNSANTVSIYDSDITRTEATGGNGALKLYCSAEPCNTNTVNLYSSTFTDSSVTNSSLNVYWKLSVTNSLGADVVIYNETGDSVSSFSDATKEVWLREYYITPVDTRTNSTPHDVNWTKTYYEANSTSLTMDSDKSLELGMEYMGMPVIDQIPSVTGFFAVTLGFGIMGLFSLLFLFFAVLPTERSSVMIAKITIAGVIVMLILANVYIGLIT